MIYLDKHQANIMVELSSTDTFGIHWYTFLFLRLHIACICTQVIDSLQGQDTGLRDHGELIKVHVVPYDTLWRSSPDSKVLAAIAIYEMALRLNLLPTPPNSPDLSHL